VEVPELRVGAGEILALIGPNGSGKTTLMMALAGLVRPHCGDVRFEGRGVGANRSLFEYRRKIAMVFQEPLLLHCTVFDNVATGLKVRKMKGREVERRVLENLDRFRIAHLRDRSSRTLSGGEAQRASLARAFAIQPQILFLDEPFASLDPPSRESLIEDLEKTLRQTTTTTVFATHDRLEAIRLSDRIAVMRDGRILQIGPPSEVIHRPVDDFVASFISVEKLRKVLLEHLAPQEP
jgi:tungstate transport system ATP-binding protein